MNQLKQKPRNSTIPWVVLWLVLLLSAHLSFAQKKSHFSQFPNERAAFAKQLAQKANIRREEAEAWAKSNGVPMRIETGHQLKELVAVRNGKPLYVKTLNAIAAISTVADLVRQTPPYNLDGAGLKVGIWDGGSILTTHQEFGGRITIKDGAASDDHATHVGGTIAAEGIKSAAMGMAPAIWIDSYKWDNDKSEMTLAAASAPGESANRLYLSNHSYGYDASTEDLGQYNSYARDLDQLIWNAQYYLPFWSAGNDRSDALHGDYKGGYDTISYGPIAKNVMAVGAVNDAVSGGLRSLGNATMSSFSSWGPADDGRIKPDIVANGVGVYSCDNGSNSDYNTFSGTSMSSPNACGSAALLVEYYKELFNGGAMQASTLKGLILHTADDLGNPGPDYQFGWGLMNTKTAADLLKDVSDNNSQRVAEGLLASGNMSNSYTITASEAVPLKVTLCWTDPPGPIQTGSDTRTPALINDLDLKITGPGGTYYPYKLSYTAPAAIATANSENSVDNVEQVYIEIPTPGEYTIIVDCDEALYDNHPSPNIGGDQAYSLLISGLSADSDNDGMPDHWESQYFSSLTNAVTTADADGDGANNLTEYISGYDPTDPDSVFAATTLTPPLTNGSPIIITWDSVTNRIYSVDWNDNLLSGSFTNISGDLPYPANSYTDDVDRASSWNFYRIGVRLNQ